MTTLAVFLGAGALMAALAGLSLLFPGSPLDPMWRLNPSGREALGSLGPFGALLMITVATACAAASVGLWRGRRWGYRCAVILFLVHLAGDIANVVLGIEPRAVFGIPIVAAILFYLSTRRVRAYFAVAARFQRVG